MPDLSESFGQAVEAVESYLRQPRSREARPLAITDGQAFGGRAHGLFLEALRQMPRLEAALASLLRGPSRPRVRAVFLVAGVEILAEPERLPLIVDHAVNYAKAHLRPGEVGLMNAVLRRLPEALEKQPVHAHPAWLVERWEQQFGAEATAQLLDWNQRPAENYVHLAPGVDASAFDTTTWRDFYLLRPQDWPPVERLLAEGRAYIQDPFAQPPVELLAPQAGEDLLDLCAAPGGKSWQMLQALAPSGQGRLVSVDLPGERQQRLEENLARVPAPAVRLPADVLKLSADDFARAHLPSLYDAVMLDAPCSNTGVIRRRPDVKLRLRPADFVELPRLQGRLLERAARFVKPGGRLVYSTCSLETEENQGVVDLFLKKHPHFHLRASRLSYPWREGHDGGAAFRLERRR